MLLKDLMRLIIDTNVFISALIKNSVTRELIVNSPFDLYFPEFELKEIKKYEKLILKKSGLSRENFVILMRKLLKYVHLVKEKDILDQKSKAKDVMDKIDENDSVFIASALSIGGVIWSDDKHFQKQEVVEVYTTRDILNIHKTK